MASSPRELIARAGTFENLGRLLFAGLGAIFLAGIEGIIGAAQAISGVIIEPLGQLGQELAGFVSAMVGGAAMIVNQGAITTVASLLPGAQFDFGPLTFSLGIGAALAGASVLALYLRYGPTSDLIPFSFTDIPFIGAEEDEE